MDTSRVGLPSQWCGPPTGASEDRGYLHTESVCRDRNGRTGQDYPYSGKSREPPHTQTHQTPTPTPTPSLLPHQTTCPPQDSITRKEKRTHTIRNTEGGTGCSCPPQTMKAQTITRITINYYIYLKKHNKISCYKK